MDLSAITAINGFGGTHHVGNVNDVKSTTATGMLGVESKKTEGTLFDSILNSAIDNIKTTNSYLSDAENEEIKFALGETENTHDLTIALQKASTALQYTVAVRDKVMGAYRELMQMQI